MPGAWREDVYPAAVAFGAKARQGPLLVPDRAPASEAMPFRPSTQHNEFAPSTASAASLALTRDEVHVWHAALDVQGSLLQRLWRTLAPDERERAERCCFQRDRERWIAARGVLRSILGRYLDRDPGELRFCYGPHGKPALEPEGGGIGLRFSLSHSHGQALYAVTCDREVGIDLERVRWDRAEEPIALRCFSSREMAALSALPAEQRKIAFYTGWTRKEAYLKARGEGLSAPLRQLEVSLAPGEPAALVSTPWGPQETAAWSLRALEPDPGYVATLAVKGDGWRLRCWQWSDS